MREDGVVADAHEAAVVGGDGGEALGRGGAVPLLDVAFAVDLVGRGERLHHAGEGGVMAVAERDGDGEFAGFSDIDLAHDGEVAVERLTEVPGHFAVGDDVLIAVAGADVAAAGARESAVGSEGQRDVVLPGDDAAAAGDVDGAGGIPCAAAVEVRRHERVAFQLREQGFVAVDFYVHQHDGVVRVGDELLGDGVAAAEVGRHDANRQRVGVDVVEVVLEVALFFMEKGFAVGEEQLHVAGLRTVDGGVVDLVERAVGDGEPDAAGGGIGGGDRVFPARSPAGFEAGGSEGRTIVVQPAVRIVQCAHARY